MEVAEELINQIMPIIHSAYNKNSIIFIRDILFQHQITIRKTMFNEDLIMEKFENAKSMPDGPRRQRELVEVYRNLVGDVFDPYLSLLVGCIQLSEGNFDNYLTTNLGAQEFNKYEYVLSRLKPTNLFDGYQPTIRNAASHTGSDSIVYDEETIIFRSIKRGTPPRVSAVRLTTKELIKKIVALVDLIQAIVVAVNIFGLDTEEVILQDKTLANTFLDLLASKELRMKFQKDALEKIHAIWLTENLSESKKIEFISNLFFEECKKRIMPVNRISINYKKKLIKIEVPESEIDINNNNELVNRIVEILRYGIIAEPFFGVSFENFVTVELNSQEMCRIRVMARNTDYWDYGQEKSGIYDLLHDTKIYLNDDLLGIKIDFNYLIEHELTSLTRIFPRKKR